MAVRPAGRNADLEAAIRLQALSKITQAARGQAALDVFKGLPDRARQFRYFPHFAARQLRVIARSGEEVPFVLNDLQRRIFLWELNKRRRGELPWALVLKYRKLGVTTLQQGLSYFEIWRSRFRTCRTYAHRHEDTREIFLMVSRFYDFQPARHKHRKSTAEVMRLEYPDWDSRYIAETAIEGSGRGGTLARIHLSEAAHYRNLTKLHNSLTNSTTTDAAYVLETTANGHNDFYEFWQQAKHTQSGKGRTSKFTPLFFPWFSNPGNVLRFRDPAVRSGPGWWDGSVPDELDGLDPEELELVQKYQLSPQQIYWWREERTKLVSSGRSAELIHQEHPSDDESCFLEGGESYYAADQLAAAKARCRPFMEPARVLAWVGTLTHLTEDQRGLLRGDVEAGRLQVWELPEVNVRYALGADVGEGVGRDNSSVLAFNGTTGEQAFTWKWNRLPPGPFGERLALLGWAWKAPDSPHPAFTGTERQNHGHAALLGQLTIAGYPADSVYHQVDETAKDAAPQKRAGWSNDQKGHEQLTDTVGRILREGYPVIRDETVVASIRRVAARDGGGAEFTGRDEAVAAGLAAIILPHAKTGSRWALIGGQWVDLYQGTAEPRESAGERDQHGGGESGSWFFNG